MALIVEDGTGLATAESYTSVAECDTYLANNGITVWAPLLTAEKEQALRRATNFMLQAYRTQWKGQRVNSTQRLDWPRWNVQLPDLFGTVNAYVPSTEIPSVLKNATSELALLAAAGDLNEVLPQNVISKQVGPLKVVYDKDSPQQKKYVHVNEMLSIYLTGRTSGAMIRLVRC